MQRFLEDPRVRLLRNEVNRGKGYSVRRGMLEAHGEVRLMCDADCAPPLSSLSRMEALTAQAEVVADSRTRQGQRCPGTNRCAGAPQASASSSCAGG